MDPGSNTTKHAAERERLRLVYRLERWLDRPLAVLGVAWLALLVLDLTRGLSPLLSKLGWIIWAVFVVDFLVRLALAPRRLVFLRKRWLTALSLLVPALRIARFAALVRASRAARAARGIRLVRVLGSVNRGMKALGHTMQRRGLGYVLALTLIVLLAGSAGFFALERDSAHPSAPRDFGSAVWWTAMVLATMGSEYWPQTAEGRVLCLLLALYGFAMFGYVTATLATFFIGQDAESRRGEAGSDRLEALANEVRRLRRVVEAGGISPDLRGAHGSDRNDL